MRLPDVLVPPLWAFDLWDALRRPQSWTHSGRWVVAVLAFLVLSGTGLGWTQLRDSAGLTEIRRVDALVDLPSEGPRPVLTVGATIGGASAIPPAGNDTVPSIAGTTYLVAGVDSRAGSDGSVGAGDSTEVQGARSDTIALIHVSPNGVPKVVSIPRDSGVYRPACAQWNDAAASYGSALQPAAANVKINSSYAVGGPRCLVATVQQLTGVKIDKFVGVDFVGLIHMVDEVGGVDITTPYPLVDDELGVIVQTAGTHHLNGSQALAYARARKIAQEGKSDYGRIKRQQKLVEALTVKIKEQTLQNPSRITELARSFTRSIFGDNISVEDLLGQLRTLTGAQYQTLPTDGTDDTGNEIVDRRELGLMLQRIWGGVTNPDDSAPTSPSSSSAVVPPPGGASSTTTVPG